MEQTTQNIESFVEKLRNEGLESGRVGAEKILTDARKEAEEIVAAAERRAQEIINDGEGKARALLEQGRGELALATRDALSKLQQTVQKLIGSLLKAPIEQQLNDPNFVQVVLREVILQYARADAHGRSVTAINVPEQMLQKLNQAVMAELASVDKIKGGLNEAGFEYTFENGTVQVTASSVAEVLSGLVGPHIREVMEKGSNTQ
ncbi:MAG: hypothetical protein GX589_09425 [Deltaproteobacteria bacterium]|nr:hypothetical protein [Deltaproteobacteria bacterium]